jgi:membrane protein DedA with SNARE-associated domain
MNTVLALVSEYKYVAMFCVLLLCGLGLPLPEEVTLISSGLAVGWGGGEPSFLLTSLTCVIGILAGDCVVFFAGRNLGGRLLDSRVLRFLVPQRRQKRVAKFFAKHGSKTVFFARFFAGLRIGVYFYAGQHGMRFWSFIFLDLLGALISGPTSIWVGRFAATRIADPEAARHYATQILHRGQHWLYLGIGTLVAMMIAHALYNRVRDRRLANGTSLPPPPPTPGA